MWSCIYGNSQCVLLIQGFFVKIISARMFSIPHIAGGGRLCLERHWPRDRRRHDSWRRLQTFKAKPPGKYGGFGGLIGEFDVPFGSRDKATLEDLWFIYVESHKMIQRMTKHISMQAAWSFFLAKVSSTRSSCRVMVVCLLKLQMRKKDRRGFAWDGVAFGLFCSEAKTQCCFLLNVRCSDCFKHLGPQPKGSLDGKGFGWFVPPLLLTYKPKHPKPYADSC